MSAGADFDWDGGPDDRSLHLKGAITVATLDDLIARLKPELQAQAPTRLELGAVTQADSAGLAFVLDLAAQSKAAHGRLPQLGGLSPQLSQLIRLYRLETFFPSEVRDLRDVQATH